MSLCRSVHPRLSSSHLRILNRYLRYDANALKTSVVRCARASSGQRVRRCMEASAHGCVHARTHKLSYTSLDILCEFFTEKNVSETLRIGLFENQRSTLVEKGGYLIFLSLISKFVYY